MSSILIDWYIASWVFKYYCASRVPFDKQYIFVITLRYQFGADFHRSKCKESDKCNQNYGSVCSHPAAFVYLDCLFFSSDICVCLCVPSLFHPQCWCVCACQCINQWVPYFSLSFVSNVTVFICLSVILSVFLFIFHLTFVYSTNIFSRNEF